MDKILVKSLYDPKYHRAFYYFHMFRKSTSVYFFVLAGMLAIYMAIQNTIDPEAAAQTTAISWTFAVLICLMAPVFTFGKVAQIVKASKKERGTNVELMEFTKAKITRKIDGSENKAVFGWDSFESAYEVKDCFYFYIDKDRGLIIPKADIVEGNLDLFRKLIQNNFPRNKKGKVKFKIMYKTKPGEVKA
ncbi:MAG TPA: hypothetical protein DD618_04550 [Acholeplasmatales bacterium]|nr:hypothetical protein [Acholeplasmatales bacterium]